MKRLLLILIGLSTLAAAECEPVKLEKWQFLDHNCKLFTHTWENGTHYIVKKKGDKIVAREAIDCKRAVLMQDGTWEYQSHLASAEFYCPYRLKDKYAKRSPVH